MTDGRSRTRDSDGPSAILTHRPRGGEFADCLARFFKSEDGVITVFFLIAMPALMAIALLVIDIGRGDNLHFDLQKGADGLALAAAAELNGTSTAITRADLALATLVKNQARFADGGPIIIDSINGQNIGNAALTVRYLSTIPADDDTAIDNSYVAATPEAAAFAEVTITPVNYTVLFPVQYILGGTTLQIGATAVAGFTSAVCNFTPMFMCNPYEGTAETLEDAASSTAIRRRLIEMRQKGPGAAYAAGNFGYLAPPTGNPGANAFADMIATVQPPTCFGGGVELRTGEAVGPVRFAINVRFDVYDGFFSGKKNDSDFRPGLSVRKGYEPPPGNACTASPASNYGTEPTGTADYMAMPRDDCFYDTSGTYPCTRMNGRMGEGFWNFEAYWNSNFPGIAIPNGWSNASPPTRYQVYRYEVDDDLTVPPLTEMPSLGTPGEVGAPACYGGGTLGGDLDRRLLYGALIDCDAHADQMSGASGGAIPVLAFASFFLTEPVQQGGPNEDVIRTELVDITGRFGGGSLEDFERDNVQLYR